MPPKLRRRLCKLTPEQEFTQYQIYLRQWLDDEILTYELIAREAILKMLHRPFESLTEDEQFEALTIAYESMQQARKEYAENAAAAV